MVFAFLAHLVTYNLDFTEFSTATSVEVFLSTYGSGWSLEINGIPVSGVATQKYS